MANEQNKAADEAVEAMKAKVAEKGAQKPEAEAAPAPEAKPAEQAKAKPEPAKEQPKAKEAKAEAPAPTLRNLEAKQSANLDLMMSVPMQLSVEIGRTKKTLKEILELGRESLVVLDKLAGESVDLSVNGQYVAKGEVVVVDDHFGIRITDILTNDDMMKKL